MLDTRDCRWWNLGQKANCWRNSASPVGWRLCYHVAWLYEHGIFPGSLLLKHCTLSVRISRSCAQSPIAIKANVPFPLLIACHGHIITCQAATNIWTSECNSLKPSKDLIPLAGLSQSSHNKHLQETDFQQHRTFSRWGYISDQYNITWYTSHTRILGWHCVSIKSTLKPVLVYCPSVSMQKHLSDLFEGYLPNG